MNKFLTAVVLSVTLSSGLASAYAGDHCGKHCKMMKDADTNQDGKVDANEFKAAHQKCSDETFKKLDTNADGVLDKTELQAGRDKKGHRGKSKHDDDDAD
ncbi:MAG: EF-hand domain-containing protein [Methylophilaceae bacterium]|nr:EF-hand domain-containing protein [Methylophilaceae bacterium]